MGNKASKGDSKSANAKEHSIKEEPQASPVKSEKFKEDKSLFQHNPTELAKDEQGRLHPKWSQVVKKSQQKHKQKTQQLVQKIAEQTKQIGEQCNQRFSQDETKLIQCFKIVAQPIWKIQKKGQQTIMKLGQIANKCLLNNKKQDQCVEEVRIHLHTCLEDTLKEMKKIHLDFQ